MKKFLLLLTLVCFVGVAIHIVPVASQVVVSAQSMLSVTNNVVWEENGLHFIEFGSYPRTFVGKEQNARFEENFNEGTQELFGRGAVSYFATNGGTTGAEGYIEKLNPCFEYRGERFVRVESMRNAPVAGGVSVFTDGTEMDDSGTVYWFRVEPIRWIILNWDNLPTTVNSDGDNTATYIKLCTAESIAANIPFSNIANISIWEDSTARGWLNGTDVGLNFSDKNSFISDAFSSAERALIEYSVLTTNGPSDLTLTGLGAPESITTDRIFILSFSEVVEHSHVFSNMPMDENSGERLLRATDYALANNARVSYQIAGWEEFDGNVWWWLRTAQGAGGASSFISFRGHQNGQQASNINNALRPAMRLSLDLFDEIVNVTINLDIDSGIKTESGLVLRGNGVTVQFPPTIDEIERITINGIAIDTQTLNNANTNGYFIIPGITGDTIINVTFVSQKYPCNNNGLSLPAILGIIAGCLVALGLVVCLILFLHKKKKRNV
ncbi:MAG: DUF6273 domain-containing protein [Firmicutes bacterium]|nr:DUF6273 domain-containing protein [Bacillota bacterium]